MSRTECPNHVPAIPGFEAGEAPWLSKRIIAIDTRICTQLRCPRCGSRRMNRQPYYCLIPMRYRMYAVCPCGESVEM
jgi:hypothetical protein